MARLIHRQGGIRTIYEDYEDGGHLLQLEEFNEKKTRTSVETWPDEASAKKAFSDGLVTWGNWEFLP